jgi:hypothetical protein
MLKVLKPMGLAVLHLGAIASACSPNHENTSRTTAVVALDSRTKLVVGAKLDERLSKEIAVSGRDRIVVPDTDHWACGGSIEDAYLSNVAWIELVNPSEDTLSLSLQLDGLERTYPRLFVYERTNVPVGECLTLARDRKLAGASSVVVGPTSSAYVLLSSGSVTGVYTLSVETEHIIAP